MPAQIDTGSLAIIAGSGDLPGILSERFPDALFLPLGQGGVKPGRVGNLLIDLRARGITKLCLIGGLRRPNWLSLWPSIESWKLVFQYGFNFAGGDDALLTRLRRVLEGEGFELVGIRTLCPDLLAPSGPMFEADDPPTPVECALHIEQAKSFGREDKGQSIVVVGNHVVDSEDRHGTDALILRNPRNDAVLVKAAKPQQDLDLDLPTIGPETIDRAGLASFRAIVVEAGFVIIVNREKCIALARQHNISLIGASA